MRGVGDGPQTGVVDSPVTDTMDVKHDGVQIRARAIIYTSIQPSAFTSGSAFTTASLHTFTLEPNSL
jgi:hypothetical protein